MCYSTALRKQKDELEERLRKDFNATFAIDGEYEPYYHQNGFSHRNLQIIKMDDPKRIFPASWGLVPNWAKTDPESFRKKTNTLNARSESIFEKSSYRDSARDKRCLILADGFFEPHHEQNVSIPYFCFQPSKEYPKGDLFLFAGLYNELDLDLFTATILTVEANSFFAEIHNKKKRMPLVLDENLYLDWLDDISEQSVNEIMATGFTNKEFLAHPVSRDLYKKDVDTNKPYIIEEVERNTLF
jgi:putative SOS response-associated peptidase YedK